MEGVIFNDADTLDPFASDTKGSGTKVHIRIQQRNRRKSILTIQGLEDDLDIKRIFRAMRKLFKCNGAVINDEEYGDIIQLQGDHRQAVKEFLVSQDIYKGEQVIVHGF